MADLLAPIQMSPPESGQEIAEQIKNAVLGPFTQGNKYQSLLGQQPGPNIGPDLPKLIYGLARALGLADPSGMMGGPAGFIYKTSPLTSPQILKSLDTIKRVGAAAEEIAPRVGAITKEMPVNLFQPLERRPSSIAEYLSPSPLRPLGTANIYRPDPTALLHEGAGHGLQAMDPEIKNLVYDLYMKSPTGTETALTKLGVPPNLLREEFGARLIEDTLAEQVAKKLDLPLSSGPIPFTPEAKEEMWKLLQTPGTRTETGIKSTVQGLSKTKPLSTSDKLLNLYNDVVTFTTESNPIRSKIETDPFARVRFTNDLKTKINNFDDSPFKNKLMKDITSITDPKDPKSALKLELIAQDVHLNTRLQAKKYEDLLKAEFGETDANKIIDKLWSKLEEGPLLKSKGGPIRVTKDKANQWIEKGWSVSGESTTGGGTKYVILNPPGGKITGVVSKEMAVYKPMYYKVPAEGVRTDLYNLYPEGTSTLQMIKDGVRTATTRSQPLGKIGDVVKFDESGDVYRITRIKKLEKGFDWNDWAQAEGWDPEYIKSHLSNQVKPGAYQTFFEKVGSKSEGTPGPLLKSERGSFSNKPIGRQAVKEQKDIIKNKEIIDMIKEEIGKYIPMSGGSRKGSGLIVNKTGKISPYLEELPSPTSYDPKTGARKWEF
jgi:hypothetical protein